MGYGSITKEEAQRRKELFKSGIKVCSTCKRELPLNMFTSDKTTKTGLSSLCKDCQKEQRKKRENKINEWFENNQERVKEKQHEYSITHAEEKKAYNQANKEYFKQKRKEHDELYKDEMKERRQKHRHTLNARFSKYKIDAEKRNLSFNISVEDFDRITKQPCYYCGDLPEDKFGNKFTGVDRIDSNIGYEIDNVVPCCPICNRMKLDYDLCDWINKLLKIVSNLMKEDVISKDFFKQV